MKDNTTQQIAEKLESLDTLPEGYHPDLASKWALLEEAMEGKAAAGWYFRLKWMALAASILLLCTTGVWLHVKHRENGILGKKISSGQQLYASPVEENNATPADPNEKAAAAATAFKEIIKTEKQAHRNKQSPNSITGSHLNEKTEPLNTVQLKEVTEDGEQQQTIVVADPQPLTSPEIACAQVAEKKKKQHYVTMDFNKGNKIVPPAQKESIFAQLFQLKIFPDMQEPITTTNAESNFLKIKKKF